MALGLLSSSNRPGAGCAKAALARATTARVHTAKLKMDFVLQKIIFFFLLLRNVFRFCQFG
jgi:hypothetical protein